jgi:peptidyl-prolyl cis-trans isomerase A (cyclophilin A)
MFIGRLALTALFAMFLVSCATSEEPATTPSAPAAAPVSAERPPARERVRMTTTLGDIVIELDRERAPVSVANFLVYVDRGEYDGTVFHRVIDNFMIQGGGYSPELRELPSRGVIKNEWANGLKNVRGTIAMAREKAPDSATREFYINVADNPRLDTARDVTGNAGYAVFGRVVDGMDVVDKIRRLPTGARNGMENVPEEPPVVTRVTRENR